MFEEHAVASHQGRHDAVDCDEIGVIPGGHRQYDAERFATDETFEVRLRARIDVGECARRDLDHVPCAFQRAVHFVRCIANRPPHLPRQLGRDLLAAILELIAEPRQHARTLLDGDALPRLLRLASKRQRTIDLRLVRERTLDVNTTVDGGEGAEHRYR
jgi:hypothetical protein